MSFFSDILLPIVTQYGLLAIFVTMTLESACIPIPSEIVVPFGGVLAARGDVPLWAVVAVATLANLVGSVIAYALGRYGGRALFERYGKYVLIRPHHLAKADEWFERRGEITVFLTRMMPGVRTFISVPAGIGRMNLARFLLYSLLGSVPWNLALALLGWYFGANWEKLQAAFHEYNLVFYLVLALAVAGTIAWAVLRRRRGSQEPDSSPAESPGADDPES